MERQLEIFDIGIGFKSSGINQEIRRFIFWRNVNLSHEMLKIICNFLSLGLGVEILVGPALNEEATVNNRIQILSGYSGGGFYVEEDWIHKIRPEFADLWAKLEKGLSFTIKFGGNAVTISAKREIET